MRELQLFTNVEFGHIRRMEVNGKPYVVASDVAKILGYKNPSKATNDHCKKSKMKVGTDSLGHRQTFKVIPESDIYRLIQCCKTKSEQFRESFINNLISEGLLSDNYKILISRDEIEFLDQLEEALKPFNIKGIRQYHVLNYRIDYYISSLNIAIEYDENNHKDYSYDAHEVRQQEIENKLGCRFIRVSDKNTHSYNLGLIIKNIFNL